MIYMLDGDGLIYSKCITCSHFDSDSWLDRSKTPKKKCAAYHVIPDDIWEEKIEHLEVLPNQIGSHTYIYNIPSIHKDR
ncbi:MAG: hypothetical protein KKA84_09330 [Bacteroidetes bacterium]|nr:hypothetical protein [Bacteroidota bacterium]